MHDLQRYVALMFLWISENVVKQFQTKHKFEYKTHKKRYKIERKFTCRDSIPENAAMQSITLPAELQHQSVSLLQMAIMNWLICI